MMQMSDQAAVTWQEVLKCACVNPNQLVVQYVSSKQV